MNASRGGWGVDEAFVRRWRWRMAAAGLFVGATIYWLLPKVAIAYQGTGLD